MRFLVLTFLLLIFKGDSDASWLNSDFNCLAANIYYEARGEDTAGQYMVAFVTMNRAYNINYPSTICGVVKQKDQFSWYNRKVKQPKEDKYWKKAKQIANIVLKSPYNYIRGKSRGALFYHAKHIKPDWAYDMKYITKVDNHLFYK